MEEDLLLRDVDLKRPLLSQRQFFNIETYRKWDVDEGDVLPCDTVGVKVFIKLSLGYGHEGESATHFRANPFPPVQLLNRAP